MSPDRWTGSTDRRGAILLFFPHAEGLRRSVDSNLKRLQVERLSQESRPPREGVD